jgi:hypothetical protein
LSSLSPLTISRVGSARRADERSRTASTIAMVVVRMAFMRAPSLSSLSSFYNLFIHSTICLYIKDQDEGVAIVHNPERVPAKRIEYDIKGRNLKCRLFVAK